tara:strand:+ start:957 stop:1217 length:261 start_codon:yes stop_codon:yes gene_type:complete
MTIGDRNKQPDWDPEEINRDWYCVTEMGIIEIRMLYNVVCGYLEVWPGSPKRPVEELRYLQELKTRLFAMISDYNFKHISMNGKNG